MMKKLSILLLILVSIQGFAATPGNKATASSSAMPAGHHPHICPLQMFCEKYETPSPDISPASSPRESVSAASSSSAAPASSPSTATSSVRSFVSQLFRRTPGQADQSSRPQEQDVCENCGNPDCRRTVTAYLILMPRVQPAESLSSSLQPTVASFATASATSNWGSPTLANARATQQDLEGLSLSDGKAGSASSAADSK